MDNINSLFPPVSVERSIFLKGNVPSSKNSKEIGFYYLKDEEESKWFFNLISTNNPNGILKKIRPNLRMSKVAEDYIKEIVVQIIENKRRFQQLVEGKPKPYHVQLLFVRQTHGRWDFHNMVQIIGDCISGQFWKNHATIPHITTKWIEDDDISNVIFVPPLKEPYYIVDKEKPGVWITVL